MTATNSGAARDKQPVIVAACSGYRLVRNGVDNWVLEHLGHDAMNAPTWGTVMTSELARSFGLPLDCRDAISGFASLLLKTEV